MLNFFSFLFVFLFGLIVGSFLNCLIYRLETEGNFLKGRSFCPHCKHILSWRDLIPILSFIWLGGKCRYCQQKIFWQYPLVEILTALIFLLIFNYASEVRVFEENFTFFSRFVPLSWNSAGDEGGAFSDLQFLIFNQFTIFNFLDLIYYLIISSFLIVIFVYDLKHYIIPDKVIYPAIVAALIFNSQFLIFNQFSIFKFSILSALGAAAFFLTIVLISRGKWMGAGDIKLAFLMGLILGWPGILVALVLAFYIGAIFGLGLIALAKKKLKSEVPFAPFLVAGTFLALFWGNELINWYQVIFLLK